MLQTQQLALVALTGILHRAHAKFAIRVTFVQAIDRSKSSNVLPATMAQPRGLPIVLAARLATNVQPVRLLQPLA